MVVSQTSAEEVMGFAKGGVHDPENPSLNLGKKCSNQGVAATPYLPDRQRFTKTLDCSASRVEEAPVSLLKWFVHKPRGVGLILDSANPTQVCRLNYR